SFLCRPPPRSTPFPYTTLFRSSPRRLSRDEKPARSEGTGRPFKVLHPGRPGSELQFRRVVAVVRIRPAVLQEPVGDEPGILAQRSEEHTSELQSRENLVCRLLL